MKYLQLFAFTNSRPLKLSTTLIADTGRDWCWKSIDFLQHVLYRTQNTANI